MNINILDTAIGEYRDSHDCNFPKGVIMHFETYIDLVINAPYHRLPSKPRVDSQPSIYAYGGTLLIYRTEDMPVGELIIF